MSFEHLRGHWPSPPLSTYLQRREIVSHILIGLIGKKRSGKDSIAAPLIDEYGYARVAFADPLKRAALKANPIVGPAPTDGLGVIYRPLSEFVEELGWEVAKDTVPGVRSFLQTLGEAIRDEDEGFWLRKGLVPIDARTTPVVVTDCRFPNEADNIRARGGYIIRVIRPGLPSDGDTHTSETALDDYDEDMTLVNDGTLDELQEATREIAAFIAHHID